MKLSKNQINKMIKMVFSELKEQKLVTFKVKEEQAFQVALEVVSNNIQSERALDEEVNKMLDDLERQHGGEFQRYKMFPMLKKRLAKEKGFVL